MDQTNDLPYWVAIAHFLKIGPTRWASLRSVFPTAKQIWEADTSALINAGLEQNLAQEFITYRHITNVEEKWLELEKLNIKVLTIIDDTYPELLKQIFDPPVIIFYKGKVEILSQPSLAVVGTRRATPYGLRVAHELVTQLAGAGLNIVSGLAYGVDAIAHRSCLLTGGATVAVLACGLDNIYPIANQPLADDIVMQGGVVLSEFPPHTAPLKQNFPYRNRIIAGLCQGTLVIEAAPGSGALLTAKHALESNREVFTVPGSIFSDYSKGTNDLLKLGAHPVTQAEDVLNVFGLEAIAQKQRLPLNSEQEKFLQYFSHEPQQIDELVRQSSLSAGEFMSQLTMLEMSGYVKEVGGQKYIKIN